MEKHYIRSNARFIVGPTGIAYDNRSGQVGDEERGSSGYNPSGYNRGSRARVDEKVDDAGKAGRRLAMILGIAALMAIPAGWPINLWLSGFILLAGSLRLVAKKLQLSNSPATSWKKWGAVIAKDASNTALSVITGLAVVWSLQLFLRWQGDFSGSMVLAWERAVAGAYDRLVSALSLTWLLVLLVVLLPLAWLWPQRKLISHLATARKWGGRFLVMLIAITSFTFFTSASVSTSERVLQAMRGGAPPGDPALGKPVDADAPAPATSGPGGVLAQASPLPMPSPTPAVSTPNHPSPSVRAESKDEFDDEDLFRKLNATAWALRLMKNPRVQPGVGEAFYRHNAAWALQVEAELMAHAAVNALSAEAGAFAELRGGNVRPSLRGGRNSNGAR